ncbi:hypothetical protein GH714_035932 [Hevea brasiliensis]|uniref:Uncharacterized protein n=1 Tax=Hevea brasiliensis TaxID=3981 RepID=A0A6A6M4C1_HEVBR|nr:hypothetical protein GH714_035932 [Hevea brasiliensis]
MGPWVLKLKALHVGPQGPKVEGSECLGAGALNMGPLGLGSEALNVEPWGLRVGSLNVRPQGMRAIAHVLGLKIPSSIFIP